MYPSWVPRNTRLICTLDTNEANRFHSGQGVQVPVQTRTPSLQHRRPGLSVVLRPPPNNPPITVGSKRAKTHNKRVTSISVPISKYVLMIISLWPEYHPQQRMALNRHRWNNCNLSLAQLPTRSKSNPNTVPPDLQLLSIYIYIPCESNMIIVTIIYFLSLVSDR
jgi:hypothetical protein